MNLNVVILLVVAAAADLLSKPGVVDAIMAFVRSGA